MPMGVVEFLLPPEGGRGTSTDGKDDGEAETGK